jgi:hypothetical protein
MRSVCCVVGGVAFWLATGASGAALAQSDDAPASKSNKDQYWLLNPVPDAQMRDFETDRPPKANVPYTVDAGHFQYEADIVNFTTQASGPTHTETLLVINPTLKVGVTNNVDLEFNMAPVVGIHAFDGATGMSSTVWGNGDLFVRAKVNLWGDDGGSSAFALIPYVKAPTAPAGIGNGAVEDGVIAPLSFSLPNGFTLLFNSELDALKDSADDGRHANYVDLVNLSHQIVKDVTLYVELWSDFNNDPTQKTKQYSFDTALAWTVCPNLQLDVGANAGLNSQTPALQVFAGISQRF